MQFGGTLMQAYILSVAGAVLLSAVVSILVPDGKLGPLIRGMSKLITLILLVSPVISLFRGGDFTFDETAFREDTAYLAASAERAEESDERAVEAWLESEYGILAEADVDLAEDGSYSAKSVTVRVSDFGIYDGEKHIDISLQIEEMLEKRFGCGAEVLAAEEGE